MPGKVGGIETYIRKLIKYAPELAGIDEIVVFVHRDNRASLQSDVSVMELPWGQSQVDAARILEAFTPWRARAEESLIADSGVDVVFFTQQSKFPRHRQAQVFDRLRSLIRFIMPAEHKGESGCRSSCDCRLLIPF